MISNQISTHISEFSDEGLNIGKDSRVMTYLYGLSDFWSSMFEDTSLINLMFEANALLASDIYNKFLQLTSSISLEDIQTVSSSQIKLILLNSSSLVNGSVENYTLPSKVAHTRFIANRALLPTSSLEENVDFFIDDTTNTILFSKSISSYKFSYRILADGTKDYALWFVDAKIDEDLIYNNFAKLIGVDKPDRSTDNFKNFVYGMYYLYINGPNLKLLRRGMNLALGVPLARDTETVLETRKYNNTDQYIVVTDQNSYIIPYGLIPSVNINDVLAVGDELASWVEVKDYQNDGDWWINFMIPTTILPSIPNDIADRNRYATTGSYCDYLMRNYLKKHTFLVNVKTVGFKNIQDFQQLAKIIHDVKPSYTTPIYVWTVPTEIEEINFTDILSMRKDIKNCVSLTNGIYRFTRRSTNPMTRGCPQFTRQSVPAWLDDFTGRSDNINGLSRTFNNGIITGYINPQSQFKPSSATKFAALPAITPTDIAIRDSLSSDNAWMRVFNTRGQHNYFPKKSLLSFSRNLPSAIDGTGMDKIAEQFPAYRLIHLHTTTILDIQEKFAFINSNMPTDKYVFTLFKPDYYPMMINDSAINESYENNYFDFLTLNFNKYFNRSSSINYLGPFCPLDSYKTYTPLVSDLRKSDFLVFIKVVDYVIGVFWATKNFSLTTTQPYIPEDDTDTLSVMLTGKLHRGLGPLGSPVYLMRGADGSMNYNIGNGINEKAINDNTNTSASVSVTYSDRSNTAVPIDRSGRGFITRKIFR